MKKLLFVYFAVFSFASSIFAEDPVYKGIFSSVALSGFDAVAYFTAGKAVEGSKKLKAAYNGAEWHFSSQENLEMFKANPSKYAPQYGGYCAWRMGYDGDFVSGDPEQWSIIDGKLYINYDEDIKKKWEIDISGFIKKADAFWLSTHKFKSLN